MRQSQDSSPVQSEVLVVSDGEEPAQETPTEQNQEVQEGGLLMRLQQRSRESRGRALAPFGARQ